MHCDPPHFSFLSLVLLKKMVEMPGEFHCNVPEEGYNPIINARKL
jgi:hypothetical protein